VGVRARGGSAHTGRGAVSFLTEVLSRARGAGASGPLTLRADSGFYSTKVVGACVKARVAYSITIKMSKGLHTAIDAIAEPDWAPIPYFLADGADVAETTYRPFGQKEAVRLIVRRVRPTPGSQLALFTSYSYHAFVTDRLGETIALESDHRRHAEVELVIRDLNRSHSHCALISPSLREQSILLRSCLYMQATAPPPPDVHGGQLTAVDPVQHGLAGHPERLGGLVERQPAAGGVLGHLGAKRLVEADPPWCPRGELLTGDEPVGQPAVDGPDPHGRRARRLRC